MPLNLKASTTTTVERELFPIRAYVLLNMSPDYINSVAGVASTKRLAEAWVAKNPELRDYQVFETMESLLDNE